MEARDEIIRQTQAAILAERQRAESDLSGSPLKALFDASTVAERAIILEVLRGEARSTLFHYEVCIQRIPLDTLAAIVVAGCFCAVLSMLPAFYVDPGLWGKQPLSFAALACVGLSLLRLLAMLSLRKRYPTTYYTLKFTTLTLMLALATVGVVAYVFFWAGWWAVIYALALLARGAALLANPKTLTEIYDIQKHPPERPFDATMLLGGLLYLGVYYLGFIDLGLIDLPPLWSKLLVVATLALSLFLGWLLAGSVAFYALRTWIHLCNLLRKRQPTEAPAQPDDTETDLLEQLRLFGDLSPEEREVLLEAMRAMAKENEGQ